MSEKIIKKFITTAARQEVSGSPGFYEAVNNPELKYEVNNSYPVLPMINAYVEEGDAVELIIVRMVPEDEKGKATAKENFDAIEVLVTELCMQKKAFFLGVKDFEVPDDEQIDTHLNIFERLIGMITGNDRVFVDVTYGTKTQMLALVLAINYVYQAVPGAKVECVVYGNYNFQSKQKKIYDITALFLMNQIVNRLSVVRHSDPIQAIRNIIGYGQEIPEDEV